MDGDSIILIGGGTISPMVRKVEYALALKGLEYENERMMMARRTPRFLEINPLGQVPAIIVGDFEIGGSSIICGYLDALCPTPPLVPADPLAEAHCTSLTILADDVLWDLVRTIWLLLVVRPIEGVAVGENELARVAEVRAALAIEWQELERWLERGSAFLIDDEVRLCDLAFATLFSSLLLSGHPIGSWPGTTRLTAYAERLAAVPAIRDTDRATRERVESF